MTTDKRPKRTKKQPQTTHRRVTEPGDKERVLELYNQGLSQRDIGRETGLARLTIRTIVKEAGGQFNQAMTAEATAARLKQLEALRAELAEELLFAAIDLHRRAWEPHEYYERTADQLIPVTLPLPNMRDQRDIYASIETTIRTYKALMDTLAHNDSNNVKDVLEDMLAGIKQVVAKDKKGDTP